MIVLSIACLALAGLLLYGVYRTLLLELQYHKHCNEMHYPLDVNPPLDKEST